MILNKLYKLRLNKDRLLLMIFTINLLLIVNMQLSINILIIINILLNIYYKIFELIRLEKQNTNNTRKSNIKCINNLNLNNCSLDIILGCMYSGKTTELIKRIGRFKCIGINTLLVNSTIDSRCNLSVKTHSNIEENALKVKNLMSLLNNEKFINSKVIGIDEAQFFDDLYIFILECEKLNKIIIVSGLDGDYLRKPFGQILNIIPLCDSVIKLQALDMISNNGTKGIFTKRITKSKNKVLIGSNNDYLAVSRSNYLDI